MTASATYQLILLTGAIIAIGVVGLIVFLAKRFSPDNRPAIAAAAAEADAARIAAGATNPAAIEIRRYATVAYFQADAPVMAAAGWYPISQVEASGGARTDLITGGVVCIVIGVFVFLPLILLGIILAVAGAVSRQKQLVVTYRPQALLGK